MTRKVPGSRPESSDEHQKTKECSFSAAIPLEVTTKKAVAARMELEFYAVAKLLAGQPPAALIERIKTELQSAAWGEGGGTGEIHFDPPSPCLIVLQSQPMQMALEALLAK